MERLKRRLIRIATDQRGQDMVEYAMIVLLISIPIVLVAIALSPAFEAWANEVAAAITSTGG